MYVYVSINSDKKPYWVFLERNEHNSHLYDLTISFGTLSENEDFTLEGMAFDAIVKMHELTGQVIEREREKQNGKTI